MSRLEGHFMISTWPEWCFDEKWLRSYDPDATLSLQGTRVSKSYNRAGFVWIYGTGLCFNLSVHVMMSATDTSNALCKLQLQKNDAFTVAPTTEWHDCLSRKSVREMPKLYILTYYLYFLYREKTFVFHIGAWVSDFERHIHRYMWRHIDVQANRRRRSVNVPVQAPTPLPTFLQLFRETALFQSPFTTRIRIRRTCRCVWNIVVCQPSICLQVKVDIRSRPLMIVLTHMAIRKIHRPASVHRLRLILKKLLDGIFDFLVDNEIINRMTYGWINKRDNTFFCWLFNFRMQMTEYLFDKYLRLWISKQQKKNI